MLFTLSRQVATIAFMEWAYRKPASTTLYAGVHTVFRSSIGRRPTNCQFSDTTVAGPAGSRYSPSRFDFQVGMPTKWLPSVSGVAVLVSAGSSTVNPQDVVSRAPTRPVT